MHVLAVRGDVDHEEADELREVLAGLDGPAVVDLRECSFMGSDGLRALLEGRRAAAEHGHRLVVLLQDRGPVARLFEVVGAESLFNLRYGDDREGAIAMASVADRRQFPDRRAHGEAPGAADDADPAA